LIYEADPHIIKYQDIFAFHLFNSAKPAIGFLFCSSRLYTEFQTIITTPLTEYEDTIN
jgi:hypothetical protein